MIGFPLGECLHRIDGVAPGNDEVEVALEDRLLIGSRIAEGDVVAGLRERPLQLSPEDWVVVVASHDEGGIWGHGFDGPEAFGDLHSPVAVEGSQRGGVEGSEHGELSGLPVAENRAEEPVLCGCCDPIVERFAEASGEAFEVVVAVEISVDREPESILRS